MGNLRTPRRPSSVAPEGPAEAPKPTDLTTAAWRRALRAGLAALERNDLAAATARFEAALAVAPDVPDVCAAVGHVRIRAGEFAAGVDLLVRAFRAAPDLISAACTAARTLHLELDRADDAAALLADADAENPGWPSVAIVRAELAYHKDALDDAAAAIADAFARIEALEDDAPNSERLGASAAAQEVTARIANARGMQAADRGELEQALFQLARAATAAPNWPTPVVNRGVVFARLGNDVHARSAMVRALEIDPLTVSAHHHLGVLDEREGNLRDAKARYARALGLLQHEASSAAGRDNRPAQAHATHIETAMRLAGVCARLGDKDDAISVLRGILEIDDSHRDATILLASMLSETDSKPGRLHDDDRQRQEHQHEH